MLYGLGVFTLLAASYVWLTRPQEDVPIIVATTPIEVLTPEVLKALNEKLGVLAVNVPLPLETYQMPGREKKIFLFGTLRYSNGRYISGGTLVVGFEGTRIERNEAERIDITLGAPVLRALDDTFTAVGHPESSFLSEPDDNLFEQARRQGRKILIASACSSGKYDIASGAAVAGISDLFKQAAPHTTVVVKTTKARCA